jgi:hypothetical protein
MSRISIQTRAEIPTAASIRRALLKRARDGKFLHQVQRGENFTVDRYQRAMDWLDANWPNTGSRAA